MAQQHPAQTTNHYWFSIFSRMVSRLPRRSLNSLQDPSPTSNVHPPTPNNTISVSSPPPSTRLPRSTTFSHSFSQRHIRPSQKQLPPLPKPPPSNSKKKSEAPSWPRKGGGVTLPPLPRSKTMGDLKAEGRMSIVEEQDMRAGLDNVTPLSEDGGVSVWASKSEVTPKVSTGLGREMGKVLASASWKKVGNAGRTKPQPLPTFTTNIRQIHEAQPYAYWAGRFSALRDRFADEELLESPISGSSEAKVPSADYLADLEKRRIRRVFIHLTSLCTNDVALESLRDFQIKLARETRNPDLMPAKVFGGRFSDAWNKVKGNWKKRGQESGDLLLNL
ncbi:MAG: hypothetical protein M1814_006191 [Vezdaea aestivalis]|nr:MAG: hypothetical protein M1814_006191 [Vezdaea aestivalis]